MRVIRLIMAILMMAVFAGASASDPVVKRSYKTASSYKELSVSCGIKVQYTVGAAASLEITAPKSLFDYIVVESSNGKLKIGIKDNTRRKISNADRSEIKVVLTAPAVSKINSSIGAVVNLMNDISGLGSFSADASVGGIIELKGVSAGEVDVECTTGGILNLAKANTSDLDVKCSTGGIATIGGKASEASYEASTGGIINCQKVECRKAKAEASTGGIINRGSQHVVKRKTSTGGLIR